MLTPAEEGAVKMLEEAAQQTSKLSKEMEDQREMQETITRIQQVQPSGRINYFTPFDSVAQFHFGAKGIGNAHIGDITINPPQEVIEVKWRVIDEEVNKELGPLMQKFITNGGASLEQKAELLDHLVDSVYVLLSCAVSFGLPFDTAFAIVHHSNMKKVVGPGLPKFREDGKILKPEGWTSPEKDLFKLVLDAYAFAMQVKHPQKANNLPDPKGTNEEKEPEKPLIVADDGGNQAGPGLL
jgi:hypothetical protein